MLFYLYCSSLASFQPSPLCWSSTAATQQIAPLTSTPVDPAVKKKKEVTDLVDDWLKPDKEAKKEKKKKKKAKSYLDDL